jgi:hypothetical protein
MGSYQLSRSFLMYSSISVSFQISLPSPFKFLRDKGFLTSAFFIISDFYYMVVCYFNLSLMAKVSLSEDGSADAMERRRRAGVGGRMGWRWCAMSIRNKNHHKLSCEAPIPYIKR